MKIHQSSRRFDLVLFDLDGTLVETAPELCAAVNDTLSAAGLPPVALERVRNWIGHGTRELLVQALALVSHSSVESVRASPELVEAVARFDGHYTRRCGTLSHLYPQVLEVLQLLRAQGLKLAVVTNKDERFTRRVLAAHCLAPFFDLVISGDSFPAKKPDPVGVQACLAQFQVSASRALFVGDSSVDVATARAAGVTVWLLPYGYNLGRPVQDCAPDRVIQNFFALTALQAGQQHDLLTV
jgi:phosphoglycolate phosphatase